MAAFTTTTYAQLAQMLADAWKNTPFWGAADALQGINAAVRYWNLLTGQWKTMVLLSSSSSSYFYALPSTLTFGFRVAWNGRPLTPISITGLDLSAPNWRRQTIADGGSVPTRPVLFAPCGLSAFVIWPRDTAATNSLSVDGVRRTPVFTGAVDPEYIDLGPEEESAIIDEALHIMAFKLRGPYWKQTFAHHRRFLIAAADRNSRLKSDSLLRRIMGLDTGRGIDRLREPLLREAVQMFQAALGDGGGGQAQAQG